MKTHTEVPPTSDTPNHTEAPPTNATPTPADDEEVFGRSLNKKPLSQSECTKSASNSRPVWKLRRWVKGKGYRTVTRANDTVTNGDKTVTKDNCDHVTSKVIENASSADDNKANTNNAVRKIYL